ncbi:snoRNA-binding rRNA-processing protein utp10 [Balamuthia mandrillaris]
MSLLQEQLALRTQGGAPFERTDKRGVPRRPSLLFDKKKAEELDNETIFNLGVNGLLELCRLDDSFSRFEKTLFSNTTKNFARELQTEQVNKKLDTSLAAFLRLLSPYFLLKPAHKALEWLLRRYRINEHNVTAIMECILPYHETNMFVRMVQLLNLSEEWLFLLSVKQKGVPLDRATLVAQCLKDPSLLNFISDLARNAANSKNSSSTVFSFYTVVMIEVLNKQKRVTDEVLHRLLPGLLQGLRCKERHNYQVSAYMIISQLCTRMVFSQHLISTLLPCIITYASKNEYTDALLCLFFICQTQPLSALPKKAFVSLLDLSSFPSTLRILTQKYEVTKFIRLFLNSLVAICLDEGKSSHVGIFNEVAQCVNISGCVAEIISQLLDHYSIIFNSGRSQESSLGFKESEAIISELLRALSSCYPKEFDQGLNEKLSALQHRQSNSESIDNRLNKLLSFVSLTFKNTRHETLKQGGSTLSLSAEHPDPAIRLLAVRKLGESLNSFQDLDAKFAKFIQKTLLRRLDDDDMKIVHTILHMPCLDKLDRSSFYASLDTMLNGRKHSHQVKERALQLLLERFGMDDPEYGSRVVSHLLNALFVRGSGGDRSFRRNAVKLAAASSHPLFSGLPVDEKFDTSDRDTEDMKINVMIIDKLAENLTRLSQPSLSQFSSYFAFGALTPLAEASNAGYTLHCLVLNRVIAILRDQKDAFARIHLNNAAILLFQQLKLTLPRLIRGECALPSPKALTDEAKPGIMGIKLLSNLCAPEESKVTLGLSALVATSLNNILQSVNLEAATQEKEQNAIERLVVELFRLLVGSPLFKQFQSQIAAMLSRQPSPMEFLSSFWLSADDEMEDTSALLQARSIALSEPYLTPKKLADVNNEHFLEGSLLVFLALLNAEKTVRQASLDILKSIEHSWRKLQRNVTTERLEGVASTTLAWLRLLPRLLKFREEFLADPTYVRRFCSLAFSDSETTEAKDSKQPTPTEANLNQQDKTCLWAWLSAVAAGTSTLATSSSSGDWTRLVLLYALQDVIAPRASLSFLPLLCELLQQLPPAVTIQESSSNSSISWTPTRCCILYTLLSSQFNSVAASLVNNIAGDSSKHQALISALSLVPFLSRRLNFGARKLAILGVDSSKQGTDSAFPLMHHLSSEQQQQVFIFAPVEVALKALFANNFRYLEALSTKSKRKILDKFCDILLAKLDAATVLLGTSSTDNFVANSEAHERARDLVKTIFNRMNISAKIVGKYLDAQTVQQLRLDPATIVANDQKARPDTGSQKRTKKRKHTDVEGHQQVDDLPPRTQDPKVLQRLNIVLELVITKMPHIENMEQLLGPLLRLLSSFVQTYNLSDEDHEYTKQLTLTVAEGVMQYISSRHAKRKGVPLDPTSPLWENIRKDCDVHMIVQCIRISNNPQTHNKALLLLAGIAQLFPRLVLDNIMPIFTFMGATTIRQDDNYTFQVIQKTLKSIIPPILAEGMSLKGLLQIFVDNIEHIPAHRRTILFAMLLQTLSLDYLAPALLLLFAKQVRFITDSRSSTSDSQTQKTSEELLGDGSIPAFCHGVCHKFPPLPVCSAFTTLMRSILAVDLPASQTQDINEKQESETTLTKVDAATTRTLGIKREYFTKGAFSPSEVRAMEETIIDFILDHISSRPFLNQLLNAKPKHIRQLQPIYLHLFQLSLAFAEQCAAQKAKLSKQSPEQSAALKESMKRSYEIVERLNSLMSVPVFVKTIEQLLKHQDPKIRRKGLLLFNEKVTEQTGVASSPQQTEATTNLFLGMVESLCHILEEKGSFNAQSDTSEKSRAESVINKQTALLSLEILCRNFGATNPNPFLLVSSDVVIRYVQHHSQLHKRTSANKGSTQVSEIENSKIISSALICLATHCTQLQARMVPKLQHFFPTIIKILETAFSEDTTAKLETVDNEKRRQIKEDHGLLQMSALSSLEVIVAAMHPFLSPYFRSIIQCIVRIPKLSLNPQVMAKVSSILNYLAANVDPRLILPAVFASFKFVTAQGPLATTHHLKLLSAVVKNMDRTTLQSQHKRLFKFLMQSFDYRRQHAENVEESEVESVEETGVEAFLHLVMKLNENTFKPLFLKTYDWATSLNEKASTARLILFYRLVNALTEKLKTIFVPYFGYLLDNSLSMLTTFQKDDKGQSREGKEALPHNQLTCLILTALYKCFLYDTEGFVNADKFNQLVPALVSQFENLYESGEQPTGQEYMDRVAHYLVPCIAQLAVTVADEKLWKTLNYQVLLASRHDLPRVRIAALKTIQEFYTRLGEEFIVLLPETVPFLAELMEDSVPEVEQLCQEVISLIDSHLGENESITSYFK